MKAVALLSGGLDSTLAIRLMQEQDVELEAVNYKSVFCTCTPKGNSCSAARTAVRQLGVDLKTTNTSRDFLEIIKNPAHGFGSEVNPCIDCRIMMFRRARDYMNEVEARFLVTGEVLGQRPMSQRRETMKLIEREAGLEGLVVRPLCAGRMEQTIPEQEGWVDREKFLDIQGRNRTPQMELAEELDIRDYPCPAGGCRLTDPGFAARMRDLLEHQPGFGLNDVQLLKYGRHFRLSPAVKAIVGRDENDNLHLQGLCRDEEDVTVQLAEATGPFTVVRGQLGEADMRLSAAITARYSKARGLECVGVNVTGPGAVREDIIEVKPADDGRVRELLITSEKDKRGKVYAG